MNMLILEAGRTPAFFGETNNQLRGSQSPHHMHSKIREVASHTKGRWPRGAANRRRWASCVIGSADSGSCERGKNHQISCESRSKTRYTGEDSETKGLSLNPTQGKRGGRLRKARGSNQKPTSCRAIEIRPHRSQGCDSHPRGHEDSSMLVVYALAFEWQASVLVFRQQIPLSQVLRR